MNKKWITLLLTLLFAVPCMATAAEKPEPFAPVSKIQQSARERFDLVAKLSQDDTARTEFFKESLVNTGLNEGQLASLVYSKGNTKVAVCKDCNLETAGLLNGKAYWWRSVNNGEEVVYVKKDVDWVPWFLLRCDNPVREIGAVKAPVIAGTESRPTSVLPTSTKVVQVQEEVVLQKRNCASYTILVQDIVTAAGLTNGRHHYSSGTYINGVIHRSTCQ